MRHIDLKTASEKKVPFSLLIFRLTHVSSVGECYLWVRLT